VVLNHLLNELGYSPGGGQHGYLWWLAWGDHNARGVFAVQDALSSFRQLFLQASCASLTQISNNVAGSGAALNITPILNDTSLCPQQSAALRSDYSRYRQNPRLVSQAPAASDLVHGAAARRLFYPKLPIN
jgi:hypothetical protein